MPTFWKHCPRGRQGKATTQRYKLREHRYGGGAALTFSDDEVALSVAPPSPYDPLESMGCAIPIRAERADLLFLDALAAIEGGMAQKSAARQLELTIIEQTFLDISSKHPELIHSFTPRQFEVLVASLLTNLGFSNVMLNRHSRDSGMDLWATYVEGSVTHLVVVEVKRYQDKRVGIAIVDRLNGVRNRVAAAKGMIVTTSSFSSTALNAYRARRDTMTLIDFDRLVDLLGASGGWSRTLSGLWCPHH